MNHDDRRITLISRPRQLAERDWNRDADAPTRLVLLDSYTVLRCAVAKPLVEIEADVARIILDRSGSASEYLALLASLPHEFAGDVLMIREDETGFLSSTGRGGDRVLYALSSQDMMFYLEAQGLVRSTGIVETQPPRVLQFRRAVAVA